MSTEAYTATLENKLRAMTLSPEAAKWVIKALDPVRGGPCQIPDAIQVTSLVPEYKTATVINAPSDVGTHNWDCLILLPPSDTVGAYIATNITGINFREDVAHYNAVVSNCPVTINPAILSGAAATTAGGVWTNGISTSHTTVSSELTAAYRTVARSATVYATGSELYNQGTVYAGQYARKGFKSVLGQAMSTSSGETVFNLDHYALPLDETDMATMTPGFYTAAAREGVYTVHRLTGPSQEFYSARSPGSWRTSGGTFVVFNASDPTNYNTATGVVPRILQDDYTTVSPVIPPSMGANCVSTAHDEGCTWGVIIFRGLHPSMSLTLKTVTNLELVPTSAAPSRQFVKPPAKYEPTAIAAYYALASEVPSCMAARHNFLGSILPALSAVASKVLPFLAPVAGQALSALGSWVGSKGPAPAAPASRPAIAAPPPTPRPMLRSSSVASRRSVLSIRSGRRVKVAKRKKRR